MTGTPRFEGFSPDAIAFLADLAANNDRAWFTPRKPEYERLIKRPMMALCEALSERFETRGIPMTADPARSPLRIYRDTRFSRDKSPYKTAASARFPAVGGGPSGYFHLEPGEIFVGGGLYRPDPPVLVAWREIVAAEPGAVHAALADPGFVEAFGELRGDRYKRIPPGFARDHPDTDLLTLKDLIFSRRLADADIMSPALPDLLAGLLESAAPVMRLLVRVAPEDA